MRGRTIIFSIHQPRFAIFKLFDRLSLLAAGRTVYHGKAAKALAFFESIGIMLKLAAKVTIAAGRITAAAHIDPSYLSGSANVHPRGFLIPAHETVCPISIGSVVFARLVHGRGQHTFRLVA